jgi:aminopeptidase YwaD
MLKPILIFFLLLFILNPSDAQDMGYTRKIIDTLTSSSMYGRGYVKNGNRIAADFLAGEFQMIGLKSFWSASYFQNFEFSVNSFPGEMSVTLDDKELLPGQDFIVDAASPGGNGTYDIIWLSKEMILDLANNKKFNFSGKS